MKRLLIILLVLAITPFSYAGEWSSSSEIGVNSFVNSDNVENGEYAEIKIYRNNAFLFGGIENDSISFAGQSGIDLDIFSLGIGFKHDFNDYFSIFMQAGYYLPQNDGAVYRWPSTQAEGLQREANKQLAIPGTDINNPWREYFWDQYTVDYKGNFGGKVGLEFRKSWKYSSLGMTGGIRFLELQESRTGKRDSFYFGYNDPVKDGWWVTHQKQSFTAYQVGLKYTIKSQFFKDLFKGNLK